MRLQMELLRLAASVPLAWRALENSQWGSRQKLERFQARQIRRMAAHGARYSPYYSRLFRSVKLSSSNIHSPEDLSKLPVTDKSLLKIRGTEFKAVTAHGLIRTITSSGSTGIPATIAQGIQSLIWKTATQLRVFNSFHTKPWYRQLRIRGPGQELLEDKPISSLIRGYNLNRRLLYVYTPLEGFLQELGRFRPRSIYSTASYLVFVAQCFQAKAPDLLYHPKNIFLTSNQLCADSRKEVARVFGCNPVDLYSLSETGDVAWECPTRFGYHLNAENCFIELLDNNDQPVSPGTLGRVVLTDLRNDVTPLIRYDVGDMASFANEPCPCGRGLPVIKQILGKRVDVLTFGNRIVNPWILLRKTEMKEVLWRRFLKTSEKSLTIEFMICEDAPPDISQRLSRSVSEVVGQEVDISCTLRTTLPRELSNPKPMVG